MVRTSAFADFDSLRLSAGLQIVTPNPYGYRSISILEFEESPNGILSTTELMAKILVVELCNPSALDDAYQEGGRAAVTQLLRARLPDASNPRKACFGEVVVARIMSDLGNYIVPVKKLRYRPIADDTPHGTDVVALKLERNSITHVCYLEAKLRTEKELDIGVEAYKQVKRTYEERFAEALAFILERLYESGNQLFEPLLHYMINPNARGVVEEFGIGLVLDSLEWDKRILERIDGVVDTNLPRTFVVLLKLDSLAALVDDAFILAGAL